MTFRSIRNKLRSKVKRNRCEVHPCRILAKVSRAHWIRLKAAEWQRKADRGGKTERIMIYIAGSPLLLAQADFDQMASKSWGQICKEKILRTLKNVEQIIARVRKERGETK